MYTAWDLFAFLGYFFVVVAIGFATGRGRQVSVEGYFRGGNRLPWYTIGLADAATRPAKIVRTAALISNLLSLPAIERPMPAASCPEDYG